MADTLHEMIEKLKEAIHENEVIPQGEKSLMLEKIEEWRHEDEALSYIPEKLAEISQKITPMLKEIGLL